MANWKIVYTQQAMKDIQKLHRSGLVKKAKLLLDLMAQDPFQSPPPYEKLLGDLSGAYSRRINIKHRLVYQVFKSQKVVKVLCMWTHYQ